MRLHALDIASCEPLIVGAVGECVVGRCRVGSMYYRLVASSGECVVKVIYRVGTVWCDGKEKGIHYVLTCTHLSSRVMMIVY